MRYLVDTHVWLWMHTEPERIRDEAAQVIVDAFDRLVLSAVSSWEIAIKYSIGRLPLPESPEHYVPIRIRSSGIGNLPITHSHTLRVVGLPPHHHDPFDRLLIAQAQVESLTIITADVVLARYDVPILLAA